MKKALFTLIFATVAIQLISINQLIAQEPFVYGDALPDAPELAARGEYKVGVRSLDFVNKNQINVLKSKAGIDPTYDRPLKVEVWYPASLLTDTKETTTYEEVMGMANDAKRPLIPFTFMGTNFF